jgi:ferredoxin-NADP reductase
MPFIDIHARVRSNVYVTADVCLTTFELIKPSELHFQAGQYLFLQASPRVVRAYSIASAPHEKNNIEFCVKRVEGGVASNFIWNLKEGDEVVLKGIFGRFVYKSDPQLEKIVMIGTGTGVAPLKSMIEFALLNGEQRPIHLLFGEKTKSDLFYLDIFEDWHKRFSNFTYDLCTSRETLEGIYSGRVTGKLQELLPSTTKTSFYLCGGQAMLKDAINILLQHQVPKETIYFEKFF